MSALGEFEQLVLFALLRLADNASGVAIHDEILARTGRDVSPGAIYTTIGRLEERGLVRAIVTGSVTAKVGRGCDRTGSVGLFVLSHAAEVRTTPGNSSRRTAMAGGPARRLKAYPGGGT